MQRYFRTKVFLPVWWITALCLIGVSKSHAKTQWQTFPASHETLRGALFLPSGQGPHPAVIALHGCGGLNFRANGREIDWSRRLNRSGFAVFFPDSFGSRGLGSQCKIRKRTIRAGKERIADVHAALAYLQTRSDIKAGKISLLGWSNGGSTIVNSVPRRRKPQALNKDFAAAIAFYPGCRSAMRKKRWDTRVPLLILAGAADDWTPAAPCVKLIGRAQQNGFPARIKLYPGAYHNFDHPNMPVRTRKGRAYSGDGSGVVHQGTNMPARKDAIVRVLDFLPR